MQEEYVNNNVNKNIQKVSIQNFARNRAIDTIRGSISDKRERL